MLKGHVLISLCTVGERSGVLQPAELRPEQGSEFGHAAMGSPLSNMCLWKCMHLS